MSRQTYVELCKKENREVLNGKYLLKYERDKNGQPVGVVIAFKDLTGNVRLGWSRCNTKAEPFDKQIGIHQAIKRAKEDGHTDIPHSLKSAVDDMRGRANNYFKSFPRIYS